MAGNKKEPPLTEQQVTDWMANQADERTVRRIKQDLDRPDSEVKEYMDWMAERHGQPTPRLVARRLKDLPAALNNISFDEEDLPGDRGRVFPRLASLSSEEIEAAGAGGRFALRTPDQQARRHLRIGPSNPDAPGVNRKGGGREPA